MEERATGIVLRTRPLTETSLIVRWLSREHGRVDTVARGARRPKSPFRGKLDLFFLAELSFRRSRRSDLHHLGEVRVLESFPGIRRDVARLRQAAYGGTLIGRLTETETPVPEAFLEYRSFLSCVSSSVPGPAPVLLLELRLLNAEGLIPEPGSLKLPPEGRAAIRACLESDWDSVLRRPLERARLLEMNRVIRQCFARYLNRPVEGRDQALAVAREPKPGMPPPDDWETAEDTDE